MGPFPEMMHHGIRMSPRLKKTDAATLILPKDRESELEEVDGVCAEGGELLHNRGRCGLHSMSKKEEKNPEVCQMGGRVAVARSRVTCLRLTCGCVSGAALSAVSSGRQGAAQL